MKNLQIFLPFHEKSQVRPFRNYSSLAAVDLNSLSRPGRDDSSLAESRFFLNPPSLESGTEWVALCSPRWEEKWPGAPQLINLHKDIVLASPSEGYAPGTARLEKTESEPVYPKLTRFHPGIEVPLSELVNKLGLSLPESVVAPWANNFIVHRSVYLDLLDFWSTAFALIDSQFGFELPFAYQCPKCGFLSQDGVGRYRKSRHAGFFYERVTMLFFAANPLHWIQFAGTPAPHSKRLAVKLKNIGDRHRRNRLRKLGRCTFCGNSG